MALAVQFLGGVIAIIGAIGLMFGLDALPTERGMAWTEASATAIAGGAITFAIGTAASRLDVLAATLAAGASARIAAEAPAPAVVSVHPEPQRPVVRHEPVIEPQPPLAPPATPASAPARPKFEMPSLSFGKAGAAAGAAVATVGAGMAATRAETEQVIAAALDGMKQAAPQPPQPPEPVAGRPEPVDPPIEILTPVIDDVPPIVDDAVPLAVAIATPATPEPEPVPVPESAPSPVAKDDPLAAFEQELDRLIPLKSLRAKKGRKDVKPEPADGEASQPEVAPDPAPDMTVAAAPQDGTLPTLQAPPPDVPMPPEDDTPVTPMPEVVGAYESGGAKYTMYSDGSVVAEAEGQTLYFKSLEELREFIDGGVKPA